tara:strand:- start:1051 stop:1428 length:378 start_codon:yes stop_codon:yes gene_type:complete
MFDKKAYNKKYSAENKGKIKALSKKYREDNKEKIEAYKKEYYGENIEKIKAYRKEYREKNKEKEKARKKKYYEGNRDKVLNSSSRNNFKKMFNIPIEEIPKELVEAYIKLVKIKRFIKNQQEITS